MRRLTVSRALKTLPLHIISKNHNSIQGPIEVVTTTEAVDQVGCMISDILIKTYLLI